MRRFNTLRIAAVALTTAALAACAPEAEAPNSFTAQDLTGASHQIEVLSAQPIDGGARYELAIDGDAICSLSAVQGPSVAQLDVTCPTGILTVEQTPDAWVFGDGEHSHFSKGAPCSRSLAAFDPTALMLTHADTLAQLPVADGGLATQHKGLQVASKFAGNLRLPTLGYTDGNCPGAVCESDDGSATCCCAVGDRCKSTESSCSCSDASSFTGGFGVVQTIGG